MIRLDDLGLPARLLTEVSARPFGPGDPLARLLSSILLQLASVAARLRGPDREAAEEPAISLTRALLTSLAADHTAADALTRPANRRLTIRGTAHRWGFADQAHFTREFRKQFGMTPPQWRNHPNGSQLPG